MNESSYMTRLGKLEDSDSWGFGDAFELLCDHTNILAKAFDAGRTGFDNTFKALMDVWTTMEDSISLGEIRVISGRLIDLAGGLMMTENPNALVLDKESFLAWYRRDKKKDRPLSILRRSKNLSGRIFESISKGRTFQKPSSDNRQD